MSLSIVASNFGANTSFNNSPVSVSCSGAAIGDLMIVNVACNLILAPASFNIVTTAPGWTVTQSIFPTTSYRCMFTMTKICTAADVGGTVTVTPPSTNKWGPGLSMVAVRSSTAGYKATVHSLANNGDVAGTYLTNVDLALSFQGSGGAAPTTPIADSPYGHSYTSYARQSASGFYSATICQQISTLVPSPRTTTIGFGFGTSSGTGILWDTGVFLQEVPGTPPAPVITSPAPGSVIDAALGVPITATFTSGNGANMAGYSLRYFDGTTNYYWTGSAWSTTPTYVALSVAPGASFTVTPTIGATHGPANGSSGVYGLSVEGSGSLTSAYATVPLTFDATPVVTVAAPTGVQATPTPLVSWSTAFSGSASQADARVIVYTAAQAAIGGFTPGVSPSTWDSQSLPTTTASMTVGTQLPAGSYVAYVQVTDTLGLVSAFTASPSFSVVVNLPPAPSTPVASPTSDYDTGIPWTNVQVVPYLNLLELTDSTFDAGVGGWTITGTGTSITTSSTHALQGSALQVSANSGATVTLTSGAAQLPQGGPAANGGSLQTAISAAASLYRGSQTAAVTLTVQWCNSSGTPLGTYATIATAIPASSSWALDSGHAAAASMPATAGTFRLQLTFTATATGIAFWMDEVQAMVGATVQPWSPGGFGTTSADYIEVQSGILPLGELPATAWTDVATQAFYSSPGRGFVTVGMTDQTTAPNTTVGYRTRVVSQVNGAGPFIAGPWTGIGSPGFYQTPPAASWWLQDPTTGFVVGFTLSGDPTFAVKEVGSVNYPLGRPLPVKVTDGWKGRVVTLPVATDSVGEYTARGVVSLPALDDLLEMIATADRLLLWSPAGDSMWCQHDPSSDAAYSYTYTTMGTSTPFNVLNLSLIEVT